MYERNLDYFRGVFALFVLLVHTYQIFILPFTYNKDSLLLKVFQIIGAYSVIGFVLISGFAIAMSLHKNYLKNNYLDSKSFLLKRINRIYPPFLFSLVVIIFSVLTIHLFQLNGYENYRIPEDIYVARDTATFDFKILLLNLFFIPKVISNINPPTMNGPLWSLNFEVYYYIVLFLIFRMYLYFKSNDKFRMLIIAGLISSFIIFQCSYSNYPNREFLYILVIFSIGALTYFLSIYNPFNKKMLKRILFMMIFASCLLITLTTYEFHPYNGDSSYLFMLNIAIIMVLFYIVFFKDKILPFGTRIIKISKYSFSLYVIHFPLLLLAFSIIHPFMYKINLFILSLLILIVLIIIMQISKYSSYFTERKNYK